MNLWTVEKGAGKTEWLVLVGNTLVTSCDYPNKAKQICDEHNAWQIMMERGWTVRKWDDGTWGNIRMTDGGCPYELLSYENNSHDTPVAAILAADKWLREKQQ